MKKSKSKSLRICINSPCLNVTFRFVPNLQHCTCSSAYHTNNICYSNTKDKVFALELSLHPLMSTCLTSILQVGWAGARVI